MEDEAEEKRKIYNELEMNYMYLSNKPSDIIDTIKGIDNEIKKWDEEISDLFTKELNARKRKKN